MRLFCFWFLALSATSALAIDANAVFENQKKSAFPDTVEIRMRTTVTLPGQASQKVETTVLNAGSDKSITEIRSQLMNVKMVKNGSRMSMTDLSTGKALPTQSLSASNPLDMTSQLGSASDYETPVKEAGLWKLLPKSAAHPTLFYSESQKRIVRIVTTVQGAAAEASFSYCSASCDLPGTLSSVTIVTQSDGDSTTVLVDVLSAKRRSGLPSALFTVK